MTNLGVDRSLMMRVNSYTTVLGKIKDHPWLGNGLGDTATYRFFGEYSTQNNVDSTYLTILWKMGILGLFAFLLLYVTLLYRTFKVYRAVTGRLHAIFTITVLSAFAAYLILGTISPVLITYRFNFLFGVVFAICEVIYHKEKSGLGQWKRLDQR